MRTSVRNASGILSPRFGLYDTHSPVGIGDTCAHAASSRTPSMFGGSVVRATLNGAAVWAAAVPARTSSDSAAAMMALTIPNKKAYPELDARRLHSAMR